MEVLAESLKKDRLGGGFAGPEGIALIKIIHIFDTLVSSFYLLISRIIRELQKIRLIYQFIKLSAFFVC